MSKAPQFVSVDYPTRLDQWRAKHKIPPARLAKFSGISRQQLRRLRAGIAEPTSSTIHGLVTAGRTLTGERVMANQLFDLGDDDSASPSPISTEHRVPW